MKALLLSMVYIAAAAPGQGAWVSLTTPNFEILTDAGAKPAREILDQLEMARAFFVQRTGTNAVPFPVRVFLFRSERDYQAVQPSAGVKGLYVSSQDRDFIILSQAAEEPGRVAVHELGHLVLHHTSPPLPRWLEEGTAEYYSTLSRSASRGSPKVTVGIQADHHLKALQGGSWLTAEEVSNKSRNELQHGDLAASSLFYSQSWGLVHMLRRAPRYREAYPAFERLLMQGAGAVEALQKAFRINMKEAMAELRDYIGGIRLPAEEVEWIPPTAATPVVETMDDGEAELTRADLLLRAGRPVESEKQMRKLAVSKNLDAKGNTELGLFSLSLGKDDAAAGYFGKAIAMPEAPAAAFYEYAMLLRDQNKDPAEVERLLRETIARNPNHGEAHFLLGEKAAAAGEMREAITSFEKAVAVYPRRFSFWHALALAYQKAGNEEGMRRAASRAMDTAVLPHEVEMAQALL